jgi:hypothetical protein
MYKLCNDGEEFMGKNLWNISKSAFVDVCIGVCLPLQLQTIRY